MPVDRDTPTIDLIYALLGARDEARRQAIEECARLVEDWGQHPAAALAAQIRALLVASPEEPQP